jgi:ABC-type multidrug transport system ATPase subunit
MGMHHFKVIDPDFLPHCGCELSLSLGKGELHVLVGENGIGKSTFLKRISYGEPTSLVEQANLDLFYNRSLEKVREIFFSTEDDLDHDLFLKLWSGFGLMEKEMRLLSDLSGGEGQMVKLTLGLARQAEIYLLDEPTQNLDQGKQNFLSEQIEQMRERGASFLIVDHQLEWLKECRIHELGLKDGQLRELKTWST